MKAGVTSGAGVDISEDTTYERLDTPHKPHPTAPPRRKRVTRSFSLTIGDIVTKSVDDLYPDRPRGTPIYAVVDLSKKRNRFKSDENRNNSSEPTKIDFNLPDLITNRAEVVHAECEKVLEDIKEVSIAHVATDVTAESNITDNETVFLTDDSTELTTEEEDCKMVKSHSTNNSPNIIENIHEDLHRHKHHKKKKNKNKKDASHREQNSTEFDINNRNYSRGKII